MYQNIKLFKTDHLPRPKPIHIMAKLSVVELMPSIFYRNPNGLHDNRNFGVTGLDRDILLEKPTLPPFV